MQTFKQPLTKRQFDALTVYKAGGKIDKGMMYALIRKGAIEGVQVPSQARVTQKSENVLTEAIHNAALLAADKATANHIAKHGEGYPCGFAWVHASIKGNTKLGKSFIKQGFEKSYTGGYRLWNPGRSFTQDMYAKEAGAQAYVDTVRRYLPEVKNIHVMTRMD